MRTSHNRKISFADLERTFRAAGPMVAPQNSHQAQPTAAQLQAQHVETLRRQEIARRLSKKPTDRDIPSDELADVIVGDGVERYKKLRDAERRLDSVMTRKRLDVVDNLQRRYTRREGVLRVWISNTAEGQPWQTIEEGTGLNEDGMFEFEENSQATYRVKIEGRLLEDEISDDHHADEEKEKEEEGEGEEKGSTEVKLPQQRPRFSHFFKAITVDFSRNPGLQPDGYSAIEWRKPQAGPQNPTFHPNSSEASFDTLEFERKSDENMNVVISLVPDEKSERFKLSPQLAEILDADEEDRAGAVQGIWEYCRAMGLQEDEDKRSIVCDAALRKLFNSDNVYFPHVPDLLMPHLLPAPPIQLRYTIRVDKQYIRGSNGTAANQPTIYDIRVPLPNPLIRQLSRFHTSKRHIQDLQQIVRTDEDLALLVQKLHHTNAKRKFHENLAKDPANFVRRWVSSQKRDLEVVLAEATRGGSEDAGGDEWRRGGETGLWGSQLAQESVGMWLARATTRT
nr:swi/snf and rsc complexes subunit ssr3 [Quercus suber]